ncbi:hypothetical protein BsWGS_21364 [Bradybaena similaris]
MALSMRVVNVRNKCVANSLRCFLSRDKTIIISSFSHKSNPDDNPSQQENEEDNFFGIPENLKFLKHNRPVQENQENSEQSSNGSEQKRAVFFMPDANNLESLREKRRVAQTSFGTTFGSISLDRSVLDKLPNARTEDVALKAQEILTRLNIESNSTTTSTVSSINNETKKRKSKFNKESLKEANAIHSQTPNQANHDSLKGSRHSGAITSYFDEVYFPEQSLEENIGTCKQTPAGTPSQHILGHTRGPTFSHHSEADNPVQHSNVHEVNGISQSDASKCRPASLYEQLQESQNPHSANVVDEQYFGAVLTHSRGAVDNSQPRNDTEDSLPVQNSFGQSSVEVRQKNRSDVEAVGFNEIDLQYFGTTSQNLNVQESVNQQETVNIDKRTNPSFHNIVEDYVNPFTLKQNIKESTQINNADYKKHVKNEVGKIKPATEMRLKDEASNKQEVRSTVQHPHLNMMNAERTSAVAKDKKKHIATDQQKLNETPQQPEVATDSSVITNEQFLKRLKPKITKTEPEIDKPKTAYDIAMEIRHQLQRGEKVTDAPDKTETSSHKSKEENKLADSNIKLDSKGFRVLDNQVPDLDRMTSADLVRMLKSKIIFDHEDFLAIDKPYGLPCYSQAHDRVSVTELLPAFRELLPRSYRADELHLVQGLDRDVSGAIILAKNPEVAQLLRGMYKDSDLVTQKFWAVTKGVPDPPAGIIDIPIGEAKVGSIYKMVLRPRFLKDEKFIGRTSKARSERAITEYKVLSSYLQSALVECVLLTNAKHQIRLHLASGLGTPILGDHKYSNFAKLAPQKLHREMLELLKIRQASVRHIAMHLHCRSIILKDYKGRMIFLTTYPPSHFRDNMRNLRIPKVM